MCGFSACHTSENYSLESLNVFSEATQVTNDRVRLDLMVRSSRVCHFSIWPTVTTLGTSIREAPVMSQLDKDKWELPKTSSGHHFQILAFHWPPHDGKFRGASASVLGFRLLQYFSTITRLVGVCTGAEKIHTRGWNEFSIIINFRVCSGALFFTRPCVYVDAPAPFSLCWFFLVLDPQLQWVLRVPQKVF